MDRSTHQVLSGSEVIAGSLLAAPAAVAVVAYLIDRAGGAFAPSIMLPIALAAGSAVCLSLARRAEWKADDTAVFTILVTATFGGLVWIARPSFFPLGAGPDLTHHLLLIQYLEQHWRLVHDPRLGAYLGEMVQYTPGSHTLVALAAAWFGTTGLHAIHVVVSAAVALKVGFIYLIAQRILPRDLPRVPLAAAAALSLFASETYALGSFAEFSFVAQVVAELFAVATWWALVVWTDRPRRATMCAVGCLGSATFLVWPVLTGPLLLVIVLTVLGSGQRGPGRLMGAVSDALPALLPVGLIGLLFIPGRVGMIAIVATAGDVASPSVSAYGWTFLLVSSAGLMLDAVRWLRPLTVWRVRPASDVAGRRLLHIPTPWLFGLAILAQAAVLYGLARFNSNAPYMALKMFYLLLCVQAVGVAIALAGVLRLTGRVFGPIATAGLAWILCLIVVATIARPLAGAPQSLGIGHHAVTSPALERAGIWARDHLPAACVTYLVADDGTAYWLHLAVLGNPRRGVRAVDHAAYELTPRLVRWVRPESLPYAIADLTAVPSDLTEDFEILARFDTAAVVKRRGATGCPDEP